MEISVLSKVISVLIITILTLGLRIVNWVWIRPKKLEKYLRSQGLTGNSYKILYGDLKESSMMSKEEKLKSINVTDDMLPHILPFVHKFVQTHGKNSFTWHGPIPKVNIMNLEDIKDVYTNLRDFQKPTTSPIIKLLVNGLSIIEGDKWELHRKIINPAFRLKKLKIMLPAIYLSAYEMTSKWEKLCNDKGSCELDVWPYLENLTRYTISKTTFGSSYEDGSKIVQIQKEQTELIIKAIVTSYIPGRR